MDLGISCTSWPAAHRAGAAAACDDPVACVGERDFKADNSEGKMQGDETKVASKEFKEQEKGKKGAAKGKAGFNEQKKGKKGAAKGKANSKQCEIRMDEEEVKDASPSKRRDPCEQLANIKDNILQALCSCAFDSEGVGKLLIHVLVEVDRSVDPAHIVRGKQEVTDLIMSYAKAHGKAPAGSSGSGSVSLATIEEHGSKASDGSDDDDADGSEPDPPALIEKCDDPLVAASASSESDSDSDCGRVEAGDVYQLIVLRHGTGNLEPGFKIRRDASFRMKSLKLFRISLRLLEHLVSEGKAETLSGGAKFVFHDCAKHESIDCGSLFEDEREEVIVIDLVRDDESAVFCPYFHETYQRWWNLQDRE